MRLPGARTAVHRFVAVWQTAMAESIMDLKDLKMPKPQADPKQVMDMIMGFQKSQVCWSVAIGHYMQMCHKHGIQSYLCVDQYIGVSSWNLTSDIAFVM